MLLFRNLTFILLHWIERNVNFMKSEQSFKNIPSWLWWVLGVNLLINLLQAGLTPLDPDEAYYWMYSLKPALGYFDHPPAVAIFIKAGTMIFPGTLGIRTGTAVLNSLTLLLVWFVAGKPTDRKSGIMLMTILLSMPFLQVYGFIATPDAPLLFFTALYLLLHQKALTTNKLLWFVLSGICMAALLYSKYHGILIILLLLIAHPKLLLNYRYYIAGAIGVILFLPHLYWQYLHDFPSFRYHLKGRDDPYELKHTITYLINQIIIFSPLILPYTISALKQFKLKDPVSRSFRFLIYGFLIFFFYTTFKGHVEPQWTAILSIPLSIIVWNYLIQKGEDTQKKAMRLVLATVFILGIARLLLMLQPETRLINLHMKHEQWVNTLKTETSGLPVIFQNSYRDASVYSYYSGQHAYTITDMNYRKNQFDIWDDEKDLYGKKVFLAGNRSMLCDTCRQIVAGRKSFVGATIDSFIPFQKTELTVPEKEFYNTGENMIDFTAYNPYPHEIAFNEESMPLHINALFYKGAEPAFQCKVTIAEKTLLHPKDSTRMEGRIIIPSDTPPGIYNLILGIGMDIMPACKNSKRAIEVIIR